jgi:hypothetical protein
VDIATFRNFLRTNDLAVIVSRNVTTRDQADEQQPFNLRVAGTTTKTAKSSGKVYDISHLQLFQADLIRGINGGNRAGRRVLAQNLRGAAADWNSGASVRLGEDGSMAAFVPARRAMTWQLTDPSGNSVVRERYWLTFQPGEIRSCASCHGANRHDQLGNPPPENAPEALRSLLRAWKAQTGYANQLRFASWSRTSPGKLKLQNSTSSSQLLILETSPDLFNWVPIQTNTSATEWNVDANSLRGFFRINAR